jgi:hypothetical protein
LVVFPVPGNSFSVTGADQNGCSAIASTTIDVSLCVNLTESEPSGFRVFPNPCHSELFVVSENHALLTISNSLGEQVYSLEISSALQRIDLNLIQGVYTLELQLNEKQMYLKLIVDQF